MRKILSFLLAMTMMSMACIPAHGFAENTASSMPDFKGLNDPSLLPYMEDTLYEELVSSLDSSEYFVENVSAIYISQEYLDELEYNSRANIFFGYTLAELNEQFQGTRYVFTLGDHNETVVQPFEAYDDTFDRVIHNVAVGTGVILVCVTVSVATGGTAPAVSMIFAAAAKTGTACALSGGFFGGLSAAIVTAIQTGDMDAVFKAAALGGSEGYKWGAISGALSGGAAKAVELRARGMLNVNSAGNLPDAPNWRESELRALEQYGGNDQVSFLNGEEVSRGMIGSTRPDIVREVDGHIEAIEVKNYNLSTQNGRNSLIASLKDELPNRAANLPEGATQRIVLDAQGRNYSPTMIEQFLSYLSNMFLIPVDIMY